MDVARAYADAANTLRTPGYALLGIRTGLKLPNGSTVLLEAGKLPDERYVSDMSAITDARLVSNAIFYPGEGRSVLAGPRYSF